MEITSVAQQSLLGAPATTASAQKVDKIRAQDETKELSQAPLEKAPEADTETGPTDVEQLRDLVEKANQTMEASEKRLLFSIHEETGFQIVQVFDRDTEKLLRQYPPDEYLSVAEQILNTLPDEASGMFVEELA